jgi:septum site-determining protein MinD
MSKTLVFFSTKGGVGKTTICLNTAVSLSLKEKKVLLLDLDLGAPLDMAKMANIKPKRTLADLISNIREKIKKDKDKLKDFFISINSYLDFLPSASSIRSAIHIKPKDVSSLLEIFQELDYDFIIIDGGKYLTDILIKIFDHSNLLFLVVTPDILSVYQTEWILDTLQSLYFPLKMMKIILNRAKSKGAATVGEVKSIFPVEIFSQIPSEGKTAGVALNKGVPVVLDSPKSRLSIALRELAESLLEREDIYLPKKELSELRVKRSQKEEVFEGSNLLVNLGLLEPIRAEVEERDPIINLKQKVHRRLIERMDLKRLPVEILMLDREKSKELRREAEKIVNNILAEETKSFLFSLEVRKKLIREIIDEALGLGPLEDLIRDPQVTEIMVNNKDQIYIEKNGKLELTSKRFTSNEQVKLVIDRILAPLGRRIDESSPYVDARLPDGSRVNAIIPPLSLTGPTLTIRKFPYERLTMKDLIERFASLTPQMAKFLEACVKVRKNILVSGATASGKTTLLNILSAFIPEEERIITIEDAAELKLSQTHWIRLEARPPNIEGKGEITVRDLFRNSLRMRPDRIVVGEVRGKEVLDMLQAMNTGHDGSLSTVHANSPSEVIIRLDSMILMSGIELPLRAIREMIASAIDLIVHTARFPDGSRKVVQISEIVGMLTETQVNIKDIFVFKQEGVDSQGKVIGKFCPTGYIPTFYKDILARGIDLPEDIFSS